MAFTVTSQGQFIQQLNKMRQSANENKIAFTLKVPDELIWWVWLEYGTGIRGDNPTQGYNINPVNGDFLHFYNVASGRYELKSSVFMPGIPAFHMITSIQDEIAETQRQFVTSKLKEFNYDFGIVKAAVQEELMPLIKEMVVDSFRTNLPNHIRDTGRLDMSAAEAFEQGVEIVAKEEEG